MGSIHPLLCCKLGGEIHMSSKRNVHPEYLSPVAYFPKYSIKEMHQANVTQKEHV